MPHSGSRADLLQRGESGLLHERAQSSGEVRREMQVREYLRAEGPLGFSLLVWLFA
jgi:hypothetical protein